MKKNSRQSAAAAAAASDSTAPAFFFCFSLSLSRNEAKSSQNPVAIIRIRFRQKKDEKKTTNKKRNRRRRRRRIPFGAVAQSELRDDWMGGGRVAMATERWAEAKDGRAVGGWWVGLVGGWWKRPPWGFPIRPSSGFTCLINWQSRYTCHLPRNRAKKDLATLATHRRGQTCRRADRYHKREKLDAKRGRLDDDRTRKPGKTR